jgi:hypothetical protein
MSANPTTLDVSGTLVSQNGGTLDYEPQSIVNFAGNVGQSYELALTNTPVLVTLPANTQWFGVMPPPNNSVGIHHKWAVGDTGGKINPQVGIPAMGVDSSSLSFYLWADSAVVVQVWSG